jgi:hypothetical protein
LLAFWSERGKYVRPDGCGRTRRCSSVDVKTVAEERALFFWESFFGGSLDGWPGGRLTRKEERRNKEKRRQKRRRQFCSFNLDHR